MKWVSSQIARFLLPAIYVESLDAQAAFESGIFLAALPQIRTLIFKQS